MGRPKKQDKLEDIFWAPPAKDYKNHNEPKSINKKKREMLFKAYEQLYKLSDNTLDTKERYRLDRLIAKYIPM